MKVVGGYQGSPSPPAPRQLLHSYRYSVAMSLENSTLSAFRAIELNAFALDILRESSSNAGRKLPEISLSSLSFGEVIYLIYCSPHLQDCRYPDDPLPRIRLLPHVRQSSFLHRILQSYLMAAAGVRRLHMLAPGYCSSVPCCYTCLLQHIWPRFCGSGQAGII